MPRGDVTKLPKWARQEIERLERDLEDARAALSAGPEDSDTFAEPYSSAPRPLGRGPRIDFRFGDEWGQRFTARLEGEELVINGGDGILIQPWASNVVKLRVGR